MTGMGAKKIMSSKSTLRQWAPFLRQLRFWIQITKTWLKNGVKQTRKGPKWNCPKWKLIVASKAANKEFWSIKSRLIINIPEATEIAFVAGCKLYLRKKISDRRWLHRKFIIWKRIRHREMSLVAKCPKYRATNNSTLASGVNYMGPRCVLRVSWKRAFPRYSFAMANLASKCAICLRISEWKSLGRKISSINCDIFTYNRDAKKYKESTWCRMAYSSLRAPNSNILKSHKNWWWSTDHRAATLDLVSSEKRRQRLS